MNLVYVFWVGYCEADYRYYNTPDSPSNPEAECNDPKRFYIDGEVGCGCLYS